MRLHPDHLRQGRRLDHKKESTAESGSYWVEGTPATFATKGEIPWRSRIIDTVPFDQYEGANGVSLDFSLPNLAPHGHPLDTDNLCQPVFFALKKIGYFGGTYADIQWWRATKKQSTPSGVSITFGQKAPKELTELLGPPFFRATYVGPLPGSATDLELPTWLESLENLPIPEATSRLALSIHFGSSSVSLGNISTGKVKSLIDCLYPIIGGGKGAPDDWKIDLIHAEKDRLNRNPDSVKITIWTHLKT
jgi:hypothetical protein